MTSSPPESLLDGHRFRMSHAANLRGARLEAFAARSSASLIRRMRCTLSVHG
jgi:hypothetical protein